jgi:hypothetical protein
VPELGAAQAVRLDMLRRERTDAIIASGWPEPEASVFAGAVGGGFTATLEAWLESGGADRLSSLLERTTEIIHDLDGLFLRRRQRTRGRT